MAQLIIKNIGPIKDVDITLNKVNVIIGPQSSGKSTINKIACYCTWVEKKVSLDQSFDFFLTGTNFLDRLVEFHKMKGYFRQESYIEFSSEVIKIPMLIRLMPFPHSSGLINTAINVPKFHIYPPNVMWYRSLPDGKR